MAHVGGARPWPFGAGRSAPAGTAAGRLVAAVARQLEAEQDRWFLWLPVLFGTGIALYFSLASEPLTLVAMMPAVAALALHLAGPRTGLAGLFTGALLAVTLGVGAAKLRTEAVRAPVLQAQAGPIDVYGYVELIEPRATKGQRLTIRVTAMERHVAHAWPARVRVRTVAENKALKPGDPVRLRATLNPPPGPSLPGDHDFARAAWFQGLGAVGYAVAAAEIDANAARPPLTLRLAAAVAQVRQAIGERILAVLPGEAGAIANALITGERGGISEATNQAFRDSGLFHILSISGLHMVIMAGAVFFSIRLALAAIPSIALRYPIKKWAAAAAMLGAFAYLMISGRVCDRAQLHHDLRHVPGGAARPPGDRLAQCGAGGARHPAPVAGEPARRRLPDVVRSRGGAGVGLRVAAPARCGAARPGAAGPRRQRAHVPWRHRHLDPGGGSRRGAVRHLPLS